MKNLNYYQPLNKDLNGIDFLRDLVAWADNRAESWNSEQTPKQLVNSFAEHLKRVGNESTMESLHFTPNARHDFDQISELFTDYEFDINSEFGSFVFEEQSDLIDALERDLQTILDSADLGGFFEVA